MRIETLTGKNVTSKGLILAGVTTLILLAALFFVPPIRQNQSYHSFADQRTMFGIANFLNVVSNLPFVASGLLGLWFVFRGGREFFIERADRWNYALLFAGVALTAFGSGFYHAEPNDARLVWDRLPMTLVFMSFFAATITERISVKVGRVALPLLLGAGAASVIVWRLGELTGGGDLRFYGVVQFYPLIGIPLIALFFNSRYTRGSDVAGVMILYGAAKLAELLDDGIFQLGGAVSGHTLKHIAAAAATFLILRMIKKRKPAFIDASNGLL